MRAKVLAALICCGVATSLPASQPRVHNWHGHITDAGLAQFSAETGLRGINDRYGSDDLRFLHLSAAIGTGHRYYL